MVGNDVVDLRDPESSAETLHPRFDTRVFTAAERAAIAASPDSTRQRWRLWAAKEATYKLARKLVPTTVFSPSRFEVELDGPGTRACVVHAGDRFDVQITESESALHAVAVRAGDSRDALLCDWQRLDLRDEEPSDPDAPSRAVRELLCERVAERLGVKVDELEVRRRGRIPYLWIAGEPAPVDLSLSHHGGWLAFACQFDESATDATTEAFGA
jgi:phosphopantetheine--protein transferase-like protein